MKNKLKVNAKTVVIGVLLLIPFVIQAFKSDLPLWQKIIAGPFSLFAVFLGSGAAGLIGGLVMHYAAALYRWVFNEEDNTPSDKQYDDIMTYMYAIVPIVFIGSYYYFMTGKELFKLIF